MLVMTVELLMIVVCWTGGAATGAAVNGAPSAPVLGGAGGVPVLTICFGLAIGGGCGSGAGLTAGGAVFVSGGAVTAVDGVSFAGDVADYVLSNFDSMDAAELSDVLTRACAAIEKVLTAGLTAAMNAVNTRAK